MAIGRGSGRVIRSAMSAASATLSSSIEANVEDKRKESVVETKKEDKKESGGGGGWERNKSGPVSVRGFYLCTGSVAMNSFAHCGSKAKIVSDVANMSRIAR